MIKATRLSFDIIETNSCKTLGLLDTSFYSSNQTISNATLQIISPFDDDAIELDYYKNAVTIINSNNLKITNCEDPDYLNELPDGLYTAKISICPEDQYWFEKTWYRTCQLECKYDKAFLKMKVNTCDVCYNEQNIQRLERARVYIYGVKANVKACNNKEAGKLYKAANKILDNLLDCNCNDPHNKC